MVVHVRQMDKISQGDITTFSSSKEGNMTLGDDIQTEQAILASYGIFACTENDIYHLRYEPDPALPCGCGNPSTRQVWGTAVCEDCFQKYAEEAGEHQPTAIDLDEMCPECGQDRRYGHKLWCGQD